jgi:hypothetical protein
VGRHLGEGAILGRAHAAAAPMRRSAACRFSIQDQAPKAEKRGAAPPISPRVSSSGFADERALFPSRGGPLFPAIYQLSVNLVPVAPGALNISMELITGIAVPLIV